MNWYYTVNGQRFGPVDETAFQQLVSSGQIQSTTLVWNSGMTGWKPLSDAGVISSAAVSEGPILFCSECGARFPSDEMIQFGSARVCANCKDTFAQKVREGVTIGVVPHYAGFWIRALAIFIDGIVGAILSMVLNLAFYRRVLAPNPFGFSSFGPSLFLQWLVGIGYDVWFTSQYGGTVGKLALGLRIVTAGGARLTPAQALGRYFGRWVSSFTLGIGFIMAGLDEQKRALHDRICNTRVVKKRGEEIEFRR